MSTGDPVCSVHGMLPCKCWDVKPAAMSETKPETQADGERLRREAHKQAVCCYLGVPYGISIDIHTAIDALADALAEKERHNQEAARLIKHYLGRIAALETENASLLDRKRFGGFNEPDCCSWPRAVDNGHN